MPYPLELPRALVVASASLFLVRLGPERLARILEPRTPPSTQRQAARGAVERALAISSRFVRHTCYTRGVTRYYVLRRAGLDVELVFGLDPQTGGRDGHCWIVLNGEPYLERTELLGRFVRTWSIGRDAA